MSCSEVTMQVIDIAFVKYDIFDGNTKADPRFGAVRFQLFDGSKIILGESPVSMMDDVFVCLGPNLPQNHFTWRTSSLNNMIIEKNLQVGSVISFIPFNNWRPENDGIVTMFDTKVLQLLKDVPKSIFYKNPGVKSFQGEGEHVCIASSGSSPPGIISDVVCFFAGTLEKHWGRCAMTGSSVLDHYVKDKIHGCKYCLSARLQWISGKLNPNDIDLFVPKHPDQLISGWHYDNFLVEQTNPKENFDVCLLKTLYETCKTYRIKHTTVTHHTFLGENHTEDTHYDWFYMFNGLEQKYEFFFQSLTGETISAKIQILIINGLPDNSGQEWAEFVTSRFDADIVKGVASITLDPPSVLKIENLPGQTRCNIYSGEMEFKVRSFQSYAHVLGRLLKYSERGFYLRNLTYEDGMLDAWIRYINDELRVFSSWIWYEEFIVQTDLVCEFFKSDSKCPAIPKHVEPKSELPSVASLHHDNAKVELLDEFSLASTIFKHIMSFVTFEADTLSVNAKKMVTRLTEPVKLGLLRREMLPFQTLQKLEFTNGLTVQRDRHINVRRFRRKLGLNPIKRKRSKEK